MWGGRGGHWAPGCAAGRFKAPTSWWPWIDVRTNPKSFWIFCISFLRGERDVGMPWLNPGEPSWYLGQPTNAPCRELQMNRVACVWSTPPSHLLWRVWGDQWGWNCAFCDKAYGRCQHKGTGVNGIEFLRTVGEKNLAWDQGLRKAQEKLEGTARTGSWNISLEIQPLVMYRSEVLQWG